MTKRAFILLAVLLMVALVLWLPSGSQTSHSGVAIEFVGYTNAPKLGTCAVLRVAMGTSHELTISDLSVETKNGNEWVRSAAPFQWQIIGLPAAVGPNAALHISMRGSIRSVVVVLVSQPVHPGAWRVRLEGEVGPPMLVTLLDDATHFWSHRRSKRPLSRVSVLSPELDH
jgi:hypothetical protein